jgi:hypothetical protein
MDNETRGDVASLRPATPQPSGVALPGCAPLSAQSPWVKCEACGGGGGCQSLAPLVNKSYENFTECRLKLPWAERTHYTVPLPTTSTINNSTTAAVSNSNITTTTTTIAALNNSNSNSNSSNITINKYAAQTDVLLYETTQRHLCFSSRTAPNGPWTVPQATGIQSVGANLNAGRLPSGEVSHGLSLFLISLRVCF